ncbi:MAG: alkaline phosphatase D family protein [Phycisphaerae bacterium]|nr:alkaline phosphatase D family protein [Phycisphaerae bacterium]
MKTPLIIILIATVTTLGLMAAGPAKSKRKKSARPRRKIQYKKPTREMITLVAGGRADQAVKRCTAFLADNPKDTEYRFLLAVAYANLKQIDKAAEEMARAVEAGVPFERFIAGPRDLLAPLTSSDAFRKYAAARKGKSHAVLHGPMLGSMTDTSVRIWVRTAAEASVQAAAATGNDIQAKQPTRWTQSKPAKTTKASDYTAVIEITGLKPDTEYVYTLTVDGKPVVPLEKMEFRTFPARDKPAKFSIAFGGGAGYTPWKEHMWTTIDKRRPLAMLLLGDNVYIDMPTVHQTQRYCYYRRQGRREFRALTARTPVFAIYDDHDFGTNDCIPGPDIDTPPWKRPVWKLFTENWANPYYGGGERQPGCWFDFQIGDVDFIMLDGRYYRTKPKLGAKSSMLGPAQKKWLYAKLKNAKGTFKVICSPVPWTFKAKGKSGDTWNGFQTERNEIFAFLAAQKIDGVILLSADRHRSDVWKLTRPGGYALYEFESSRLTNIHVHAPQRGSLFSYNKKNSYGQLTFDTTRSDPTVTYRIFSIDDELIHTLVVKKSEMKH